MVSGLYKLLVQLKSSTGTGKKLNYLYCSWSSSSRVRSEWTDPPYRKEREQWQNFFSPQENPRSLPSRVAAESTNRTAAISADGKVLISWMNSSYIKHLFNHGIEGDSKIALWLKRLTNDHQFLGLNPSYAERPLWQWASHIIPAFDRSNKPQD